jgi:hypothetical protein
MQIPNEVEHVPPMFWVYQSGHVVTFFRRLLIPACGQYIGDRLPSESLGFSASSDLEAKFKSFEVGRWRGAGLETIPTDRNPSRSRIRGTSNLVWMF